MRAAAAGAERAHGRFGRRALLQCLQSFLPTCRRDADTAAECEHAVVFRERARVVVAGRHAHHTHTLQRAHHGLRRRGVARVPEASEWHAVVGTAVVDVAMAELAVGVVAHRVELVISCEQQA